MPKLNKDDIVKAEIIKAAENVFQKWGFNKTTMEDIAHSAGKGKSTLYYYYKSKEEIFSQVVDDNVAKITAIAVTEIEKVSSAEKKLKVYFHTILRELIKFTNLYSLIRKEIKGQPELLQALAKKYDSNEEKFIQGILLQGIENKEFTSITHEDVHMVSHGLMRILRSMAMELLVDTEETGDQIDKIISLFLTGL
jgi:AcrR family transcriptional regulator